MQTDLGAELCEVLLEHAVAGPLPAACQHHRLQVCFRQVFTATVKICGIATSGHSEIVTFLISSTLYLPVYVIQPCALTMRWNMVNDVCRNPPFNPRCFLPGGTAATGFPERGAVSSATPADASSCEQRPAAAPGHLVPPLYGRASAGGRVCRLHSDACLPHPQQCSCMWPITAM